MKHNLNIFPYETPPEYRCSRCGATFTAEMSLATVKASECMGKATPRMTFDEWKANPLKGLSRYDFPCWLAPMTPEDKGQLLADKWEAERGEK